MAPARGLLWGDGMTRGIIIALALAVAGCLGRYTPGTDPQPAPPAHSQPPPSSPSPSPPSSPSPSPSPSPPQTPPTPTPTPADGGTTPPSSDGGTTSACAQLDACCQQLPSDQVQGCLDQVAGVDETVCQGILDQLQQNGYCL